jgi:hypothetical protein
LKFTCADITSLPEKGARFSNYDYTKFFSWLVYRVYNEKSILFCSMTLAEKCIHG